MEIMIRDATNDDVAALVELGQAFFDEAGLPARFAVMGLPDVTFCPESFVHSCEFFSRIGVMLVAEDKGQVVGMLGAAFAPAPWNHKILLAQEGWWFVRPDRRKGVGVALLKEFEKRAAARGVILCAMVAEHGLRGESVGRLYEAKHYVPAESVYWKRLNSTVH